MTVDFSSETMEVRKKWHNIFQVLKEKNCKLKIQYLVKLSFRNNEEIKIFSDKEKKILNFVISKHILEDWLKKFPQTKRKFEKRQNLGV